MLIENSKSHLIKSVIGLILFLGLTFCILQQLSILSFFDYVIISIIKDTHMFLLGGLSKYISGIVSPKLDILWALIIAFTLWGFRYKIPAIFSLVMFFGGNVLGTIIKAIVRRARPALHPIADTGFSYPSGHVLDFCLIVGVLIIFVLPLFKSEKTQSIIKTILIIFLIFVAFSRVYLNAHFPSDTIGGILLAYTWIEFVEYLYVKYVPQIKNVRLWANSDY